MSEARADAAIEHLGTTITATGEIHKRPNRHWLAEGLELKAHRPFRKPLVIDRPQDERTSKRLLPARLPATRYFGRRSCFLF